VTGDVHAEAPPNVHDPLRTVRPGDPALDRKRNAGFERRPGGLPDRIAVVDVDPLEERCDIGG
jgi:hypothetical protein